jgi:NitT/TauT family transport system permease protein
MIGMPTTKKPMDIALDVPGKYDISKAPKPHSAPSVENNYSAPKKTSLFEIKPWQIHFLLSVISALTGLVFWHFAATYKLDLFINFTNIPLPSEVFQSTLANIFDPEFYTHILVSLRRVGISFLLASGIGIMLGIAMGRNAVLRAWFAPYIEIMRPIPAVAWIPLAILMWPTEESSIIFITCLGAIFPVVLNTIHGVQQTPEVLVRAATSLGASKFDIFRHVIFPAALPSITAGLASAMGVAWFSLLAGEIISGQYGIGYFTWDAYSLVRTPDIVLGMLVIGILGTASTAAIKFITSPLLKWQRFTR